MSFGRTSVTAPKPTCSIAVRNAKLKGTSLLMFGGFFVANSYVALLAKLSENGTSEVFL